MIYRIGICDDEPLQIKINGLFIKDISKKCKYNTELKAFDTSAKLFDYLKKGALDILFLDIDLGDCSGISIAEQLMTSYPNLVIIFVTGHREFTGEAFDVEAMGYLVKPVEPAKLERVLKKSILQVNAVRGLKPPSMLIITEENIKKKINQNDIYYIERQKNKSIIHTKEHDYQVYEPISSLRERLDNTFLQVNQSEIIRINDIREIRNNYVYLKNNQELSIGRTFKQSVINAYLQSR